MHVIRHMWNHVKFSHMCDLTRLHMSSYVFTWFHTCEIMLIFHKGHLKRIIKHQIIYLTYVVWRLNVKLKLSNIYCCCEILNTRCRKKLLQYCSNKPISIVVFALLVASLLKSCCKLATDLLQDCWLSQTYSLS
jgi:hypothetical protein